MLHKAGINYRAGIAHVRGLVAARPTTEPSNALAEHQRDESVVALRAPKQRRIGLYWGVAGMACAAAAAACFFSLTKMSALRYEIAALRAKPHATAALGNQTAQPPAPDGPITAVPPSASLARNQPWQLSQLLRGHPQNIPAGTDTRASSGLAMVRHLMLRVGHLRCRRNSDQSHSVGGNLALPARISVSVGPSFGQAPLR